MALAIVNNAVLFFRIDKYTCVDNVIFERMLKFCLLSKTSWCILLQGYIGTPLQKEAAVKVLNTYIKNFYPRYSIFYVILIWFVLLRLFPFWSEAAARLPQGEEASKSAR
jgi:hypothetical protein